MEVEKTMQKYGFEASSSCSGFEWYTQRVEHNNVEALITVTNESGTGLPETFETPVLVETVALDSGNDLEAPRRFDTLKSYLDTLNPNSA